MLGTSVSLGFSYGGSKSYYVDGRLSSEGKGQSYFLGLEPFTRYYFTRYAKNAFYAELSGGIGSSLYSKSVGTSYSYTGEVQGTFNSSSGLLTFFGQLSLGFNHFFNDYIAFNSAIGYNYRQFIGHSTLTSNIAIIYPNESVTSTTRLTLNFGFNFFISRQKSNKQENKTVN